MGLTRPCKKVHSSLGRGGGWNKCVHYGKSFKILTQDLFLSLRFFSKGATNDGVKIGHQVFVKSKQRFGKVIEIGTKKKTVKVQCGNVKQTLSIHDAKSTVRSHLFFYIFNFFFSKKLPPVRIICLTKTQLCRLYMFFCDIKEKVFCFWIPAFKFICLMEVQSACSENVNDVTYMHIFQKQYSFLRENS